MDHHQACCGNDEHILLYRLIALIRRNRTCKTGLQLAIFEIQANRGCSKGAKWSARQNTDKNNFVGPKITPPDPAVSFN